jgi:hypothetical protein
MIAILATNENSLKKTLGQINFRAKNLHAKSPSEAMPRQSTRPTLGFGGRRKCWWACAREREGRGKTTLISVPLWLLLLRGTRSESVWILLANSRALALALSSGIWSWFHKRNGNSKENGEFSSSDQVQEVMLLERTLMISLCNFSLALCEE